MANKVTENPTHTDALPLCCKERLETGRFPYNLFECTASDPLRVFQHDSCGSTWERLYDRPGDDVRWQRVNCHRCGVKTRLTIFAEGALALMHGHRSYLCRLCLVRIQKAHAEERAAALPALREEFIKLKEEDEKRRRRKHDPDLIVSANATARNKAEVVTADGAHYIVALDEYEELRRSQDLLLLSKLRNEKS